MQFPLVTLTLERYDVSKKFSAWDCFGSQQRSPKAAMTVCEETKSEEEYLNFNSLLVKRKMFFLRWRRRINEAGESATYSQSLTSRMLELAWFLHLLVLYSFCFRVRERWLYACAC